MKEYTIVKTVRGRKYKVEGTLEYLLDYYKYTLECGKSYEREKGARKVNLKPATCKSLVTALNNAAHNCAANHCPSSFYAMGE